MVEISALAFAGGVIACLLVHPVIWPREAPRKRDARGRYAKERPLTPTERKLAWSRWDHPEPRA